MQQQVKAKLRFLRMGPRKVRLVADMIRGRKAEKAVEALTLLNKSAARPILKLLKSAIANAKHNFQIAEKDLRVSSITVDGGPVLKRWTPRAFGRASPIRERTSHINITLVGETAEKKTKKAAKENKEDDDK